MYQEQHPAQPIQGCPIPETFCPTMTYTLPIGPSTMFDNHHIGVQPQQFNYGQAGGHPGFGVPMPYSSGPFYYSPPINGFWNQASCPVMAPAPYPHMNMVPVQSNYFSGDSEYQYAGFPSIQNVGLPMAHGPVLMDPTSFSGQTDQTNSSFNGFTANDPSTNASGSSYPASIPTGFQSNAYNPVEEASEQGLPMEKDAVEKADFVPCARIRMPKKYTQSTFCTLCKSNNEQKSFYSTHTLKDATGKVLCPVLRTYVCPYCSATGDQAHTARYCPKLSSSPKNSAIYTLKPNSVGTPRLVRYI